LFRNYFLSNYDHKIPCLRKDVAWGFRVNEAVCAVPGTILKAIPI